MLLAEPTLEFSPSTCPLTTTPFNKNLKSLSAGVATPIALNITEVAFADATTPVLEAMALIALAFEIALPSLRATDTPSEVVAPTL